MFSDFLIFFFFFYVLFYFHHLFFNVFIFFFAMQNSAINEVETSLKKEIVIGGSTMLTPKSYMKAVAALDPSSERANIFDTDVVAENNGELNHPL